MFDLKLDTVNHDVVIENGDLLLIDGIERVAQHLHIRLATIFGEWFLDTSVGLPFFTTFAEKNPDLNTISAEIKSIILETPDVLELINFDLKFISSERRLEVTFQCRTTFGETEPIQESF